MLSRNGVFLLVAIYFIFTYPYTIRTWNLNESIGWHSTIGRPWQTYLLPLWFLLVFLTYQKLESKKVVIPTFLFWSHVLLTVIPTLYINYPFISSQYPMDVTNKEPFEKIFRVNSYVKLYMFVQVLLYLFLSSRLLKRVPK